MTLLKILEELKRKGIAASFWSNGIPGIRAYDPERMEPYFGFHLFRDNSKWKVILFEDSSPITRKFDRLQEANNYLERVVFKTE